MIAAIMQPYFFPYLGYFQLMAASDLFVLLDDVQYIQRGWVNRNRILVNGAPRWITMPVAKANHCLPINRREYLLDDRLALGIVRRIEAAYRSAPYFSDTIEVVRSVFRSRSANVAEFNKQLLDAIAERLEIATPMRFASTIPKVRPVRGQEMVIHICRQIGASSYVNPMGGLDLYEEASFACYGIKLMFLQSSVPPYPQLGASHVSSLSVIDAMMFNSIETLKQTVKSYRLVDKTSAGLRSTTVNGLVS